MRPINIGLRDALAGRIRVLRAQRGWSQEVLAELSGLHRNYIGHVERSEINLGLENLARLARGFGVSLSELLNFPLPVLAWKDECSEDSASCDCSWHENMRAAEASHGDIEEAARASQRQAGSASAVLLAVVACLVLAFGVAEPVARDALSVRVIVCPAPADPAPAASPAVLTDSI